jgi:hypothetical protein
MPPRWSPFRQTAEEQRRAEICQLEIGCLLATMPAMHTFDAMCLTYTALPRCFDLPTFISHATLLTGYEMQNIYHAFFTQADFLSDRQNCAFQRQDAELHRYFSSEAHIQNTKICDSFSSF